MFNVKIRSRHNTHGAIRGKITAAVRTIVRFGSSTEIKQVYPNLKPGSKVVEINSINGVKTSANKRLMKEKFTEAKVITAQWFRGKDFADIKKQMAEMKMEFPIVAKHVYGSRGTGNYLVVDDKSLTAVLQGKDLSKYIFEKYYDYVREYRLHVTAQGCFYTCRKMLKNDVPKDKRWFRNDSNSTWIMEENPQFSKPKNWKAIEQECVKALVAVGLDVAAFDVKVQGDKTKEGKVRDNPEFIVIESNSAPSFGEVTTKKYLEQIPQIIKSKM